MLSHGSNCYYSPYLFASDSSDMYCDNNDESYSRLQFLPLWDTFSPLYPINKSVTVLYTNVPVNKRMPNLNFSHAVVFKLSWRLIVNDLRLLAYVLVFRLQ